MAERILLGVILTTAIYFFWTQKLRTDLTAVLVMLALIVPWPHADGGWRGVLTAEEGFSGFGSSAVVMVTAMFVFGGTLAKTGAAEFLAIRLFRAIAGNEWMLQLAILGTTVLVSMFVNDTTVVLVFLPLIMSLCRERGSSPSRFLLVAAYGSLLGGQWTLIGTRSNLLISNYYRQHTGTGIGFFDYAPIAAVITLAAALYLVLLGRRFLPHSAKAQDDAVQREYLSELVVAAGSKSAGKTIDEAGWANRNDVRVVALLRDRRRLAREEVLKHGDSIIVRGTQASVGELLKSPDLQLKDESGISEETLQSVNLVTVEALLGPRSDYVGRTLDQLNVQRDYGFTVLGMSQHRRSVRRRHPSGPLAFGDSLLLLGEADHVEALRRNPNLILLVEESFPALGQQKAILTLVLLFAVIGSAISNVLSPVISIPLAAFLCVVMGCIRLDDAYKSIDWAAVITVACMIPFGLALEKTHTASDMATMVVHAFSPFGPVATMGVVLFIAIVLTQLIENAAVAIILAPLAFSVAEGIHANPKTFLVGLAICVSAAFCTPFAHESTLLVMRPGQYRFKHYLQVGIALALATWLAATFLTPLVWPIQQTPSR